MSTSDSFGLPAPQSGEVNLTVRTGDEATEVFVIDSQFHRVARSVGERVDFKLPRGLYSVKVRAGSEYREKPVILSDDNAITFEPVPFSSAAPLEGTARTHESHVHNAGQHSHHPQVTLGQGSEIYVFARDWTEKERSAESAPADGHPARGLTLRDRQGRVLVNFADPALPHALGWEPWAAGNVALDPGAYCLRLETASGDALEQTVVASPGWQTQIFLLQRNYGVRESDRRADLANASVFLSPPGWGFQQPPGSGHAGPDAPDFRLAEMARQGLANDRRVLTDEVVLRLLDDKFSNPMLGIYGAHLLLLDETPDRAILAEVIGNLRRMLLAPHPDVEALALRLDLGSDYVYDLPPMLRRSWAFVLKASVQRPGLVPEDSLASQIGGYLAAGDPWLLWARLTDDNRREDLLRSELKRLMQMDQASAGTSDPAPDQMLALQGDETTLESTVRGARAFSLGEFRSRGAPPRAAAPAPELDDEAVTRLVQTLGVPRGKLDSLLKSVDTQP